jgi:hypothetical protein
MSKKVAYSTEELVQAATWAVSYDSDNEYSCRFRREFKKAPPDHKTITAWKKDLLETGTAVWVCAGCVTTLSSTHGRKQTPKKYP